MLQFEKYRKWILAWLWVGLFMIFIQIIIGGITRLTDSGLSITEWDVVKGVIPPLNEQDWVIAFEKYKVGAKKQYESLHADMTLSEFKWIYFWEWFHRLWARTMGIVFIIPALFFLLKGALYMKLNILLLCIFLSAGAAGIFGWIMVASGLGDDTRTWVSAYKLIAHLFIAVLTFGFIYWTILEVRFKNKVLTTDPKPSRTYVRYGYIVLIIFVIQLLFGGLMAGMRAGLLHPHWPFFVSGDQFYYALGNVESFESDDLLNYEPSMFIKSWVQLFHRLFAYLLFGVVIHFAYKTYKNEALRKFNTLKRAHVYSIVAVLIQAILGILTVIYSIGSIPVTLGVLHQGFAMVLLITILYLIHYQMKLSKH